MSHYFIRVAAATPKIQVADPLYNTEQMAAYIEKAVADQAKIIVFPELAITGYTCADLFLQTSLLEKAKEQLFDLMSYTVEKDILVAVGMPLEWDNRLYNVAALICHGSLLGLVPKRFIPNYSEFYEKRHFAEGNEIPTWITIRDTRGNECSAPIGTNLIFDCISIPGLKIAAEICEDVWMPNPPSIRHAMAGATVIVNCSASDETTGKAAYRRNLINGQSARLLCSYIYANAGEGESTQDLVFSGHNLICENGTILAESKRLEYGMITADLDLERLRSERRRMESFDLDNHQNNYEVIPFQLQPAEIELRRFIDPAPFVPNNEKDRSERCEEILAIQAMGLKKRLEHTHSKKAVVGISGGLDSTLALLVMTKAFDALGLPRDGIIAVTMPCFGTTDRTYTNACQLTKKLGATLIEVDIRNAVNQHFQDIQHDPEVKDVTYENCQARERTQVLMDIANQFGGLVIGTGDMSELALGWATYNGDHMSMYGVNASVPKTLVRHLVRYYADESEDKAIHDVLYDVLDTPVSPELLPPEDGKIAQKTEDIVGPYELHDFVLYYVLRFGYEPGKIFYMASKAFESVYSKATILKWMKVFYRRYFMQQFKRSCLPDGPKVGSAAVSPRGDLRMPSDASSRLWMEELEKIQI